MLPSREYCMQTAWIKNKLNQALAYLISMGWISDFYNICPWDVSLKKHMYCFICIFVGGRGKDGAPIITFPEYTDFTDLPDEDFLNVVTYLTSIPR